MKFTALPRLLISIAALSGALVAPSAQAIVIIQDNFNYTDGNLQGNSPNVVDLAGTTFEGRVSSYDTIQVNGSVARAPGDQNNAIGISTGAYSGNITRISVDLVFASFGNTSARMGAGFWVTFPAHTSVGGPGGSVLSSFTGFRVTSGASGSIEYLKSGSSPESVAVDFSGLATNTPYNLAFDINPDGSFSNLVFNGTDYTSQFTGSYAGAFSGTATNYAGAFIAGNQNARGNWDNLTIEAVPQSGPTSLAAAGLCILLVGRRHRFRRDGA